MAAMLEFDSVTKRFGKRAAVNQLSFQVPERSVIGLLGPNGAGKSTAMRLLLGLSKPNSGTIRLFGHEPGTSGFADAIRRTGSHIETPALYERATARQNLEIHAAGYGIGRKDPRIAATLETVGLSDRSGDRVKGFSLGMRQRMSLAVAILHDPELVVLDEPTNGLDPAGVVEIRDVIRSLPSRGMTALVSSHVLGEIEKTVDGVVIIRDGKLVTSGTVSEIVGGGQAGISVRVPDGKGDAAVAALSAAGITAATGPDGAISVSAEGRPGSVIAEILAGSGVYPDEIRPQTADLEDAFLDLTTEAPSGPAGLPQGG